jgi:mannose-6-phosphate isomerase-like protein (cupin superfamily)
MREIEHIRGAFPTLPAALTDVEKDDFWPVSYKHGKDERIPLHRHPVDETLYLLRGSMTFTIAGKRYALAPGDKLSLPAGTAHEVSVSAGTVYLMGWSDILTWEEFDQQGAGS